MKAEHRHELQTNQLAEWLENSIEGIKPYARVIGAGVVAVAIMAAVYWYVSASERRSMVAASDQFVAALQSGDDRVADLQITVNEYPGSKPAVLAQLLMAEVLLNRGNDQLYVNKPLGRENVSKAAEVFLSADEATNDPMLRAWALFGLARAREALGDLARAQGDYERVIKEYPDSALATEAKSHLDNLARPSTKEFYDWFAKQDPRPLTTPGTPGLKPSFDLSMPAGSPSGDVKLPSATQPGGAEEPAGQESTPAAAPDEPSSTKSPFPLPSDSPPAEK